MQLSAVTAPTPSPVSKVEPSNPGPTKVDPKVDVVKGDASTGARSAAQAGVDALEPIQISDKPAERLDQLVGFFHRNPGWMKTGNVADQLRTAFDDIPKVGEFVRDLTEPADVGYGQAIRDQTMWQMNTGRQPNNTWWLRMNRQLVEDPLTAELAIRSGREDQLTTGGQKAWAKYIHESDKLYASMGLTPEDVAKAAAAGAPVALSDTWKGVSLLKRAKVMLFDKPNVRKALWVAHRKTLEDGRPAAMKEAVEMHRKAPKEMSFSSSWASFIGYWSWLSPLVTGNQSKLAQKLILPQEETIDGADLSWSEQAFVKLADTLDPLYERQIVKAAEAEDAAAAAAATG